jgi:hypothetical protein
MKAKIRLSISILFLAFFFSCSISKQTGTIETRGIIQLQGITTYQYGTHVLVDKDGDTIYALRSEGIDLDGYRDKKVKIVGIKIEGYPVDGGPDYLKVRSIKIEK